MPSLKKASIQKFSKEIKNNLFKKENIYFLIIIFTIFSFDRYTKNIIVENYLNYPLFINNFLNLDLIWNTGIGFGLLSSKSPLIYKLITSLIGIVILLLIYILLKSEMLDKVIYSLIIGGALGNFFDRLQFEAVPDFIDIHYNNFHWFSFNVADIFISFGIIALITKSFFVKN